MNAQWFTCTHGKKQMHSGKYLDISTHYIILIVRNKLLMTAVCWFSKRSCLASAFWGLHSEVVIDRWNILS